MGAPSLLGMTPARRRIFDAGYAFQARQEALDKERRELDAKLERERRRALAERRAAIFKAILDAMPAAAINTSKASRPRSIIRAIADKHGITVPDITGQSRSKRFVLARQEAMWVVRQVTRLSLPEIGRFFGGRDHTTVLHGVRRHQRRIDAGELHP